MFKGHATTRAHVFIATHGRASVVLAFLVRRAFRTDETSGSAVRSSHEEHKDDKAEDGAQDDGSDAPASDVIVIDGDLDVGGDGEGVVAFPGDFADAQVAFDDVYVQEEVLVVGDGKDEVTDHLARGDGTALSNGLTETVKAVGARIDGGTVRDGHKRKSTGRSSHVLREFILRDLTENVGVSIKTSGDT